MLIENDWRIILNQASHCGACSENRSLAGLHTTKQSKCIGKQSNSGHKKKNAEKNNMRRHLDRCKEEYKVKRKKW